MRTQPHRPASEGRGWQPPFRLTAPLLVCTCLTLAMALPAVASARQSDATPASTPVVAPPVVEVPTAELAPILGSVPLADLGLGEAQLGELLSKLSPDLESSEGELQALVGSLLSENPSATLGELVGRLLGQQGQLGTLIGQLTGFEPGQVVSSLTPEQLNELLDNLTGAQPTGSITAEQLEQLLNGLIDNLSGEQLQTATKALDELLAGASLSPTTVGGLAESAGMAPEALAEDVGSDSESLPAGAPALAGTLGSEGPVVGVVKGVHGLVVTVLPSETLGGSGGGGSGGAGSGGSGGQGGPGGSGTTTVVSSTSPASPGAAAKAKRAAKPAKLRIVSHHTAHGVATIVVAVPSAGRLTLSGKGVKADVRRSAKATRLTLKVRLGRAGEAALRKHRHHLKVRLEASFVPKSGPKSSTNVTVSFG